MDSLRKSFEGHAEAWEHFARAYELQMHGKLNEALAEYGLSIQSHPTAEAHTFYGWTLSFMGRPEEAIEACKRAIATDPDFGNPYNDIGAYLLQLGRPEEAIPWLEKATRARRYDPVHFPHANAGRAWEMLDESEKAIACYRRALSIEPGYTFAIERLSTLIGMKN